MTKVLHLVRHSTSTFNQYGDTTRDCPLSPDGVKLAANLSGDYDLIICSALKRARETVQYSKLTYQKIIYSDDCREFRDGNPINVTPNEDILIEDQDNLHARAQKFLTDLKRYWLEYDKILVVSHAHFISAAFKIKYYLKNCEIYDYTKNIDYL